MQNPFIKPCLANASRANWEQEGAYLHVRGMHGDMYRWYNFIAKQMTLTTSHVTLLKKLHNFLTTLREVQLFGARSRHYGHLQVRFELSFLGPENLS